MGVVLHIALLLLVDMFDSIVSVGFQGCVNLESIDATMTTLTHKVRNVIVQ